MDFNRDAFFIFTLTSDIPLLRDVGRQEVIWKQIVFFPLLIYNLRMQGIALYRKYRPKSFKDVAGQDHIVKVLEGAIELGNISHAYLFSGSRGTGKTSVARIVATELGTSANDLYEMDAASNRGIDDVRNIRESVYTLPFDSKYKVYIIDEAHMLTKDAWNAFLKTLEEPPEHVIFILATTEHGKLPETVLSRCQIFQFRKPSRALLRDQAIVLAKKEGFTLLPHAADLIALLGDGSFRDSIGALEKVLSFSKDKKISLAEVETATGAPRSSLVHDFVKSLAMGEKDKALSVLQDVKKTGSDIKIFLKIVLEMLRIVLLLKLSPDIEKEIAGDLSDDELTDLRKLAKEGSNLTTDLLRSLLESYDAVGRAYDPALPIELAILA